MEMGKRKKKRVMTIIFISLCLFISLSGAEMVSFVLSSGKYKYPMLVLIFSCYSSVSIFFFFPWFSKRGEGKGMLFV